MSNKPISPAQAKANATKAIAIAMTHQTIVQTSQKMLAERESRYLTPDETEWSLDRIASGDFKLNVIRELAISRSALLVRAHNGPSDFGQRLTRAMKIGHFQRVES
jgi:hypothetical protein